MIMGRLPFKSDLLRELNKIAAERGIRAGAIQLMGGVSRVLLSHFDQETRAYQIQDRDAPHEIVSGLGNISIKNDAPFVHLHLAVADREGKVFGGHALDGCRVYAVDYVIWPFAGEEPKRVYDNETGLHLWEKEQYEG
ncbi:MAG: DNA-binding protein [Desulfuromonadales bacterium]|nr:MAG: DNA-binding protein [Desulfuromonadales bacterium]